MTKDGSLESWINLGADRLEKAKAEVERLRNGMQGSCYCCELVGEMNQKLQAEVEFWKAKAYEAEFYEGKHEAEVERLKEYYSRFTLVSPIEIERMEKIEAEVERLKKGFQGSCYCCESVGILNQKLESEVKSYKKLAINLVQELITKCDDPIHKQQLKELESF
jgi:hypothetical protein